MKKNTIFISGALLLFSLLALMGCAETKISGKSLNGEIVIIPMVFKYKGLQVVSPYIAGNTGGFKIGILHGGGKIITHDEIQSLLLDSTENKDFVLDFDAIYHARESEMRNLEILSNPSVAVIPAETKLQRIVIFTYDKFLYDNNFRRDVGYTGFNDELSGDDLILLAVDRACTIKGRITATEEKPDIDVEIKGAGLHFLKLLRLPGERSKFVIADKNIRPRLIVHFYKSYVEWLKSNPASLENNRKLPKIPANS